MGTWGSTEGRRPEGAGPKGRGWTQGAQQEDIVSTLSVRARWGSCESRRPECWRRSDRGGTQGAQHVTVTTRRSIESNLFQSLKRSVQIMHNIPRWLAQNQTDAPRRILVVPRAIHQAAPLGPSGDHTTLVLLEIIEPSQGQSIKFQQKVPLLSVLLENTSEVIVTLSIFLGSLRVA